MKSKSAVQQLQSRIAKRQNELRYIEDDINTTRMELRDNQEQGFYRNYLSNHLRWLKASRAELTQEQVLDKTLQRGMTMLYRVRRDQAKLRVFSMNAASIILNDIKQKFEALS